MIDIVEEFNKFLPVWCKENHLPCPRAGKINKTWKVAWQKFTETVLTEKYPELNKQFKEIPVIGSVEARKIERERAKIVDEEEEKEETPWDQVSKMLK